MKSKFKKLSYILLIAICFTSIAPIATYASEIQTRQWGQATCPGMNSCYGCAAFDCSVYKVQNITVRFTYDECLKVIQRGVTASDIASLASKIATVKSGVATAWLELYSKSVSRNIEMFRTAVNKNSGLELKAEYVINKNSYSLNRYRKGTKKYIPKSTTSSDYYRVLKVTSPLMYGADVKKVQNKLNQLGYNAGKADGYYGNNTKNAVVRFQKAKKISADGMVGPQTWNKLF